MILLRMLFLYCNRALTNGRFVDRYPVSSSATHAETCTEIYQFGIYSSTVVDNIIGGTDSLYQIFGWNIVIK